MFREETHRQKEQLGYIKQSAFNVMCKLYIDYTGCMDYRQSDAYLVTLLIL